MSLKAVGDSLLELLRESLRAELPNPGQIAMISPDDAAKFGDVALGVSLYASIENPTLKNEPPVRLPDDRLQRAPLTLDLYYLLTAYGTATGSGRELSAHLLLGRAMRALFDHPVLFGSGLKGVLAGTDLELRLTLNPITVEDMTRIWSAFPSQSYRPSVSYLVSPVPVESESLDDTARVVARDDHFDHAAPLGAGEDVE